MREILFRGKRVDDGEWVEGDYVRIKDGGNPVGEQKMKPETLAELLEQVAEKVRKETAREILEPLREVVMKHLYCCVNLSEDIKFLWKKYDLELEDEE